MTKACNNIRLKNQYNSTLFSALDSTTVDDMCNVEILRAAQWAIHTSS